MKKEEIEYLEAICLNDPRYKEWLFWYQDFSMFYDVPEPAVIWTEAAMLVLVMKEVKMEKRYVFNTWNNGKSNEESYFVKQTTLYLLEHGDNRFCEVSKNEMEWLRLDAENYIFYGKLRKKRIPRCKETSYSYEGAMDFDPPMMVAEPLTVYNRLPKHDIVPLKKAINFLVRVCPDEEIGISCTQTLVTYYNTVTEGELRDEVNRLNEKMFDKLNKKSTMYFNLDMECPFDEQQVKESGIEKVPKIVLAVMNYMLNGEYRIKGHRDWKFDDFAVAMYAVMSEESYWTKKRTDYKDMMYRLFNQNVKIGMLNKWIENHGTDYTIWEKRNKGEVRYKIAYDFLDLISRIKRYKSTHF